MVSWQEKSTYLFDLDGCIYLGSTLAPGAKLLLDTLWAAGKNVGFVSNNSCDTAEQVEERLRVMGLSVQPEHIVTATGYMGTFISERFGPSKVKAAGSSSLVSALQAAGHEVIPFHHKSVPDLIVIARDTEFNYEKLQITAADWGRGAKIVATNPDHFHPGENGMKVPETGALLAAIQSLLDDKILILGKPEPYLFQYGMDMFGAVSSETVFVGDNLQTDIRGGSGLGLTTVWISGNVDQLGKNAITDVKPDYHCTNMQDFLKSIEAEIIPGRGR
ncbi:acid sugar phosphatase [Paenibacillus baekrokdamisoli]|uniref:Acid sugar phosphatase n=1 Tax=Paenibacillus baekrokdamisoli TaxID=1712516 RepID=A0A3G9IKY3_9BACL|nr:HAD-IIA family hydrolase [Paenibacillus baekrokdamisoli]MBB3067261.1 HAD superfamily hydrolase (TIGR01450 family) [Paenibacillus baekrokdamisoli]BBH19550.1 acid sugar phosphatase [Paenibacillus baekrokdamisoli]